MRQRRALHNDKGNNPTEDIILVHIYAPNKGAPKYVKQILTDKRAELDRNIVKVGDFNTPLTSMDRFLRQNINKEKVALNNR